MPRNERAVRLPVIVAARDEWVRDSTGREYIDLCMGYGSVWLGHNHPAVTQALVSQLKCYAAPGYLPTGAFEAVEAALARFIPETHFLGGIYSTGMEAIETALRAAGSHTGRLDIAGFEGSAYGRSFITAAMGNAPLHRNPDFVHRLPPFTAAGLDALEAELDRLAARVDLAAIVVEPVQMSGGGHEISKQACDTVFALARERNVPVIFDETLTGLHRCGPRFFCEIAGHVPDILVIGKGMGNGFPCAAVVLRKGFAWDRARVRPGSTFWNHPLACAAATATLTELSRLNAVQKVAHIEAVIRNRFARHEVRGRGATWCLGFPDSGQQARFVGRILERGVVVSYYGRFIRLLPSVGIELETLSRACAAIAEAYADTFR